MFSSKTILLPLGGRDEICIVALFRQLFLHLKYKAGVNVIGRGRLNIVYHSNFESTQTVCRKLVLTLPRTNRTGAWEFYAKSAIMLKFFK